MFGMKRSVAYFCALCAATAVTLPAETFAILHTFDGKDGSGPTAALIQASDGDFYGSTSEGGSAGFGTIFKITPPGRLTTLYSFCPESGCLDGEIPQGLIQAIDGDFYGTTLEGGAGNVGTIFKITPSGALTTLYSFCSQSNCTDGGNPTGTLVQAADGEFYGTTGRYGDNHAGTVFKFNSINGTLTTLHSFNVTDGQYPNGLVRASDGTFYGTTQQGGIACNEVIDGCGTVFRVTLSGAVTTLYSFCAGTGCTDGYTPAAGLIQGFNGDLYGTTLFGGGADSAGTVFKITRNGVLTTIATFDGTDGATPDGTLIQSSQGNFYGTTEQGGASAAGTIFEITPAGMLTTLYSFCPEGGACTDGESPETGLLQSTNGDFYGDAAGGGSNGSGTIFRLSLGLQPFIETQTAAGKVGAEIGILGNDLNAVTSVTFNGTPASFEVTSSSFLVAEVPEGATSGKVQAVFPTGTVSSNAPFRVLP
jgi:uncharacterized repeat protein (TIGR03803 family)